MPSAAGLINQLYSHISAISLGVALGAEIVLPPAAVRDSFAHYFSVFKERNEVVWAAAPADTLLDADGLIDFWSQKGVTIVKVSLCISNFQRWEPGLPAGTQAILVLSREC